MSGKSTDTVCTKHANFSTLFLHLTNKFVPVFQSTVSPLEGRLHRSVPSLPAIKLDRLRTAKAVVEKAVKVLKRKKTPDYISA